jgi:hypothetical protein
MIIKNDCERERQKDRKREREKERKRREMERLVAVNHFPRLPDKE